MDAEYLEKVKIYLQQEMPDFEAGICLVWEVLVFRVPARQVFQAYDDAVFAEVTTCITRIRNREPALDFLVRSDFQERDFAIPQ
jgi:hypothetical protein